ncbi:helix-turn-helix domain-containing protein [Phytomonospora endophytica]|uniref:Transcriptional regulator with XRE-family HTH domain n=1 Tax=Phytomonospora endophytica TaxID=714109 RepID=A0A841FFZ6_9ACTN|nr:helix-turn-helix transcriptional regulator [Phytomonospora endophytica]MBB6035186.1 transcriptional regulator with XRE-family HTH domain [Phytomonospora endophytica]GIG64065.1 transcriptional regulator [Phytomonospora endophytica]
MGRYRKPTIRTLWLGEAMREIRDVAGLTAKEAGIHLGRDGSTITRMEAGEVPVSEDMLHAYLEMCGVTEPHRRTDLMTIRKDAAQAGWWDGYTGDVVSTLIDRAWMESRATAIKVFEMACLPGLLQVPDYAEALMRARQPGASEEEITRWIELRMTRQHVLSTHRPLKFTCIIAEHLLRERAGNDETMKAQLNHLLGAMRRPGTDVRILPVGTCTGQEGSFEVFTLVDPYPEVAYLASSAGDICVEAEPVEQLAQAYDRLLDASLDPKASKKLITAERDKL